MHEELKARGRPGAEQCNILLKSDDEPAIEAVREALAKRDGGRIDPEQLPKGEHACNGAVEEAGRTVREMTKVFRF